MIRYKQQPATNVQYWTKCKTMQNKNAKNNIFLSKKFYIVWNCNELAHRDVQVSARTYYQIVTLYIHKVRNSPRWIICRFSFKYLRADSVYNSIASFVT